MKTPNSRKIKIKIDVSYNGSKYIDEILDKVIGSLKTKNENYSYTKEFKGMADIYITDFKNKYDSQFIIGIVKNKINDFTLNNITNHNVTSIFRMDRLKEYADLEECGQFASLLKKLFRKVALSYRKNTDNLVAKYEILKDINWKFDVEKKEIEKVYKSKKYISLFMDSSAQKLYNDLQIIKSDIELKYEEFLSKNKDTISKILKSLDQKSNFDRINQDTKKIKLPNPLPTILLQGESGTGKTLIANFLSDSLYKIFTKYCEDENYKNNFMDRFSVVNMAPDMIDGLLFGWIKGAFSDAYENNYGYLLRQFSKVLFIDEIGEISNYIQAKLLLYFDNMKIRPLGYNNSILAPIVIISATNKNLLSEINKKQFRFDLYQRFTYKVKLPSLKQRKSEIRFLISFTLQNPNINKDLKVKKISLKAIEKIESYDFPGNFRELEFVLRNAVKRAILENRDYIVKDDIILV